MTSLISPSWNTMTRCRWSTVNADRLTRINAPAKRVPGAGPRILRRRRFRGSRRPRRRKRLGQSARGRSLEDLVERQVEQVGPRSRVDQHFGGALQDLLDGFEVQAFPGHLRRLVVLDQNLPEPRCLAFGIGDDALL